VQNLSSATIFLLIFYFTDINNMIISHITDTVFIF